MATREEAGVESRDGFNWRVAVGCRHCGSLSFINGSGPIEVDGRARRDGQRQEEGKAFSQSGCGGGIRGIDGIEVCGS